jgi:hypothetical protein
MEMSTSATERAQAHAQLESARQFCVDNLKECCAELVERTQTGILGPGRVRDLAKLCTFPGQSVRPSARSFAGFFLPSIVQPSVIV